MKLNSIHLDVSIIFILILFYWCVFVSLNQTTFGPTRHLLWLTPFITIFFTYGIKEINNYFLNQNILFF